MVINYCSDARYLYPSLVSIYSIVVNNPNVTAVRLGLSPEAFELRGLVQTVCDSLTIPIEVLRLSEFEKFPNYGHISAMTFGKFEMWKTCSEPYSWYMDSDTICVGQLPDPQVFLKTSNAPLGMVRHSDMSSGTGSTDVDARFLHNAGVMALSKWPVELDLPRLFDRFSPLVFGDQDVFNLAFESEIQQLPGALNTDGRLNAIPIGPAVILHFLSDWKPWLLPLAGVAQCHKNECSFSIFFVAEREFIDAAVKHIPARSILMLKRRTRAIRTAADLKLRLVALIVTALSTFLKRPGFRGKNLHPFHFPKG